MMRTIPVNHRINQEVEGSLPDNSERQCLRWGTNVAPQQCERLSSAISSGVCGWVGEWE